MKLCYHCGSNMLFRDPSDQSVSCLHCGREQPHLAPPRELAPRVHEKEFAPRRGGWR